MSEVITPFLELHQTDISAEGNMAKVFMVQAALRGVEITRTQGTSLSRTHYDREVSAVAALITGYEVRAKKEAAARIKLAEASEKKIKTVVFSIQTSSGADTARNHHPVPEADCSKTLSRLTVDVIEPVVVEFFDWWLPGSTQA